MNDLDAQMIKMMTKLADSADGARGIDPRLVRDTRSLIRSIEQNAAANAAAAAAYRAKIDNARLPDCAGFVGAGQRCAGCRVHRRMHG